jgi:hypothetical protein
VLEGIVSDLDQVTDFSHMITLGSEQIDKMEELPEPVEKDQSDDDSEKSGDEVAE